MPMDSIICRRKLDEERKNPFDWICACPMCEQQRKETKSLNAGEPLGMAGKDISSPGASCEAGRGRKEVA